MFARTGGREVPARPSATRDAASRTERPRAAAPPRPGTPGGAARRDHRVDGPLADPARGDVDDAAERHHVRLVVSEAQVGQQVPHLAPVVEPGASDDAVGDPAIEEGLLDGPGLGVGPVHDRDLGGRAALLAEQPAGLGADGLPLLLAVLVLPQRDAIALGVFRPEPLLRSLPVAGEHGARHAEDASGRSVVLLQENAPGTREVAQEVLQVARIGGAPGVDRLIGVADHGDVAVDRGELPREPVLHQVRVLELVDQDVQVALRVVAESLRLLVEELHDEQQQVVEVDGAGAAQGLLVAGVDAGHDLLEVAADVARVGLGTNRAVLGA